MKNRRVRKAAATRRQNLEKRYAKQYAKHLMSPVKKRPPDPPHRMTGTKGAKIRRALTKVIGRPKWWWTNSK